MKLTDIHEAQKLTNVDRRHRSDSETVSFNQALNIYNNIQKECQSLDKIWFIHLTSEFVRVNMPSWKPTKENQYAGFDAKIFSYLINRIIFPLWDRYQKLSTVKDKRDINSEKESILNEFSRLLKRNIDPEFLKYSNEESISKYPHKITSKISQSIIELNSLLIDVSNISTPIDIKTSRINDYFLVNIKTARKIYFRNRECDKDDTIEINKFIRDISGRDVSVKDLLMSTTILKESYDRINLLMEENTEYNFDLNKFMEYIKDKEPDIIAAILIFRLNSEDAKIAIKEIQDKYKDKYSQIATIIASGKLQKDKLDEKYIDALDDYSTTMSFEITDEEQDSEQQPQQPDKEDVKDIKEYGDAIYARILAMAHNLYVLHHMIVIQNKIPYDVRSTSFKTYAANSSISVVMRLVKYYLYSSDRSK